MRVTDVSHYTIPDWIVFIFRDIETITTSYNVQGSGHECIMRPIGSFYVFDRGRLDLLREVV